jgi:peptidoglycan/LPS O-acetylase OafA/YrhL
MRRNSTFDWVRLTAVFLVVEGHSYALLGLSAPVFLKTEIHTLGVKFFFLLSGYLIAASWRSDPNFLRYAAKRVRRIMPALLVVVVSTVFILGPIVSTKRHYFAERETWTYLWRNVMLLPYHGLPGVFANNPLPAVNGSLWSLPWEVLCYTLTPVVGFIAVRRKSVALILLAAAVLFIELTPRVPQILVGASSVIPWFFGGSALAIGGARIPDLRLPRIDVDITYGTYLMAFPFQQIIIASYHSIEPQALVAATLALVLPLAWAMWTFIEKPMIRREWPSTRLMFGVARETVFSPVTDQARSSENSADR